jgi:hypothetical protein
MPTESAPRYFLTVDAETPVIAEGVQAISEIRRKVEREEGIPIPMTWFVRFQRGWDDYNQPVLPAAAAWFDGFERLGSLARQLAGEGDEIGWHYHAYHYVAHPDLPHTERITVLQSDLVHCAATMRKRHPDLTIEAFRFGWFFVPDPGVYSTLHAVGITVDASTRPELAGQPVREFGITRPPAIVEDPGIVQQVLCVPYRRTWNWHDWSLVPHDFSWHRMSVQQATRAQSEFRQGLRTIAAKAQAEDGRFTTYAEFRSSRSWR